jgi:hypothetical protein
MSDTTLRVTYVTTLTPASMMISSAPRMCMCTCGEGRCRCL